ncbi:MAG: Hsp20/alpha crystallin family protein [Nitrososphaerota archaeon]|nr:Hsp20/alpha crystallin family protein [Nitrososphaerota archaeon]MDG7024862.1 Hsp20/alpha crystallin family protein [Nitrososphaerota archaeon]
MADKTRKEKSRRDEESDSTALALPEFGLSRIFEDFMRPFGEFMHPLFPDSMRPFWGEFAGKEPSIDLQDRGDHYVLTVELPGFEKDDVEVRISSDGLELKGEKKTDKESKSRESTQLQSTRSYVRRYLMLPEEVVSEKVSGTMKNGVLELKLPKKEPKAIDQSKRVDLK